MKTVGDANLGRIKPAKPCILLVDDDELWVPYLTYVLEAAGFRVIGESDPRAALVLFEQNADDYAAVITDLAMPYLSGLDFARELLARRPSLHLVGMTGNLPAVPSMAEGMFRLIVAKEEAAEKIPSHLKRFLSKKREAAHMRECAP